MREICFGCLNVEPERFYKYRISDLWTMLKGWDNHVMFNLSVERQVAFVISETINKTMGGKGVLDFVRAAIPLPHDKPGEGIVWTKEKIDERIALVNKKLLEQGKKIRQN